MISVIEPAPLRPRWRSTSRRRAAVHPAGTEAQRRTAGRNFLDARGMTAQPSGEENYGPLLRHGRSRRSCPSARSAIFRGRMRARPDRAHITEDMMPPRRAGSGREKARHRHLAVPAVTMTRSRGRVPCGHTASATVFVNARRTGKRSGAGSPAKGTIRGGCTLRQALSPHPAFLMTKGRASPRSA